MAFKRQTPRRSRLLHAPTVLSAACLLAFATRAQAGVEPTWCVRLATPQIASASLGILVGQTEPPDPPPPGTNLSKGVLFQVEPCIAGGKVSLGVAKGLFPYAGAGIKLSVLRTWGHPLFTEPRRTYAGIEGEASFFVNYQLGVMKRVAGASDAPGVIVTGGIGLGF